MRMTVLLFSVFLGLFPGAALDREGSRFLAEGVKAVEAGNGEQGLELFEKAAGSADLETAAMGHYNYGTALAAAAAGTEDPAGKRGLLERAEAALHRSYTLLASDTAQKNLFLVRQELMKLPPSEKGQDRNKDNQDSREQQEDQKNGQEGQNSREKEHNREQQQEQDRDQQDSRNEDQGHNREKGKEEGKDEEHRNAGDAQRPEEEQDAPGQDGEKREETPDTAAQESRRILEKEARERAMRILERAGGIEDVQKDW